MLVFLLVHARIVGERVGAGMPWLAELREIRVSVEAFRADFEVAARGGRRADWAAVERDLGDARARLRALVGEGVGSPDGALVIDDPGLRQVLRRCEDDIEALAALAATCRSRPADCLARRDSLADVHDRLVERVRTVQAVLASRFRAEHERRRTAMNGAAVLAVVLAVVVIGSTTAWERAWRASYRALEETARRLSEEVERRAIVEEGLRDGEMRFRAIAEAAYDPVIVVDGEGRIRHWNRAAAQTFRYAEGEVLGRVFAEVLVSEEQRERSLAAFRQVVERTGGEHWKGVVQARALRRDGRVLPVELSIALTRLHGQPHAVVIARDLSERVQREAVERIYRDLADAVAAGDDLVPTLGNVCERLADAFDFDAAWVAVAEGEGRLRVQASAGRGAPEGGDVPDIAHDALRLGRLQVRVSEEPAPDGKFALVAVPLGRNGGAGGVLGLQAVRVHPVEVRVLPLLEQVAAQLGALLARARDLEELRLRGQALAAAANAIFIADADGVVVWVNPACSALWGLPPEQLVGRRPWSGDDPTTRGLWETVRAGRTWSGEITQVRPDGRRLFLFQTVTPVPGDDGRPHRFIVVQTDVTAQREAERRIRFLALHDDLTGLANRVLFTRSLRRAMADVARGGAGFAVLFLDLDRFKDINDTLGHVAGDALLRQVAERLESSVRPGDVVARMGGDEFAVLQRDVRSPSDAAVLARTLARVLDEPFEVAGNRVRTTASIGIALYDESVRDPEDLLARADTALYEAKDEGQGLFRFHTEAMQREVVERARLTSELRRAVENDEIDVVYQPQVDLDTGEVIGLEALVRWNHPERGRVLPQHFVPVAEESGLIIPIGEQVLERACADAAAWRAAGARLVPVAVNLSASQFQSERLVDVILQSLARHGLEPAVLELELTESILMRSSARVDRALRALHARGVRFAIDDFGTGYSSLQYLRRFPIDRLKIAQEFVRDLATDPSDAAIVTAVVGLARSLGLGVIAEGVETEEQAAFLREAGCREAQGFLFYRLMSAEAVRDLLFRERERMTG